MGKKFLVIVSLLVLFVFIDVKALTCDYSTDMNGISVKLISGSDGRWSAGMSSGYTVKSASIKSSGCPSRVYYSCNSAKQCNVAESSGSLSSLSGGKNGSVSIANQSGGSSGNGSSWGGFIDGDPDCQTIFGQLLEFLDKYVSGPIYFLTPIVLVILTTIDFAKAVFADEKDGMKKAQENFVKRAVAALLIFLAPMVVNILLSLLDNASISDCLNSSGIAKL